MTAANKAKFTKGPWEVDQQVNKINWILSADDDFNKAVAKVTQYGSSDTSIMNANAHLIASAPEMYAEIEKDIVHLTNRIILSICPETIKRLEVERDRKCDILAKARGE